MMVNAMRGEISAELDGKPWTLCLTLGALASLETKLEVKNLSELSAKFSSGTLSASQVLMIITAGLIGGGHEVHEDDVSQMRVDGGIGGYVEIAARLLAATFRPVESNN